MTAKSRQGGLIQPIIADATVCVKPAKCMHLYLNILLTYKYIYNCYMADDGCRKSAVFDRCSVLKATVAYQQLLWSNGVIRVDAKLLCG